MIVFWSVAAALAVYRVARMLAQEEGPFELFARARGLLDPNQRTWLGRGVNCPLCLSFWLGWLAAVAVAVEFPLSVVEFVLLALALSGAATALYRRTG